jgi:hypothetical protein
MYHCFCPTVYDLGITERSVRRCWSAGGGRFTFVEGPIAGETLVADVFADRVIAEMGALALAGRDGLVPRSHPKEP